MKRALILSVFLWSALFIGVPAVRAQQPQQDVLRDIESDGLEKAEKKRPSFWHKPAMASADVQLAYADGLRAKGKKKKAAKHYVALVHQWHAAPEAAKAQLSYAELLEELGKYQKAFEEFQYLIENFAGQFKYEDVLDHQFKIANYLRTTKRARWLFGGYLAPERALPLFEQVVQNAPSWDRAPESQYYVGQINEDLEEYDDAGYAYEVLQRRYRNSEYSREAAFRHCNCLYLAVKARPRDEQSYRLAMSALSAFSRDYPSDPNAPTAATYLEELKEQLADMYFERATYYDNIAKRPKSAIIAYNDFIRNFPSSERAVEANQRIGQLKSSVEKNHDNYSF